MKYLFVLALGLCSLTACGDDDVQPATGLSIGEAIEVNGDLLTFVAVVDESRCPIPAECIWEGIAIAVLEAPNGETLRLGTIVGSEADPPNELPYNGLTIRLDRLDPYPVVDEVIEQEDYRLTLVIE